MEVKDSHIEIYARTKKERCALPVFSECELSVEIGGDGFAEVIVKQKQGNGSQRGDYGRIAKITLHKADDMERVGKALIALAHAVREVESSNAKVSGAGTASAGLPG
jgi:hypothetical protein